MPNEENQLKEMQRKLADKKEDAAELRGEKTTLVKQLKAEGCKDASAAEKEAKAEATKAEKLRVELKTGIDKLEEDYEW